MLFFDQPVIEPPKPEKIYPVIWIRNLHIMAHNPNGEGTINVELVPMSADREFGPNNTAIHIGTNELYRAMEEVPEVAQAFTAILASVKPLKAWVEAQQQAKTSL